MDENAAGSGRENDELEWGRRHVREGADRKKSTAPFLVVRKTEILGCGEPVKKNRQVPPTAEEILRRHIRTILDRQDRMEEEMFLQLNGIHNRIDGLEDEIAELKKRGRSA